MSGYDIIGDIHAQATRLEQLLKKLGYHGFRHEEGRKIIFLGDLIDRGTEHAKTLHIVRGLMAEGTAHAVMGNHEFNAICYSRKSRSGGYIRAHTPENNGGHARFLEEYPFKTKVYNSVINWFSTLPVYLDVKGFSVVHACWNKAALRACGPYLTKAHTLQKTAYEAYDSEKSERLRTGIEILLKGPEFLLPKGITFHDLNNIERRKCRLLWWEGRPPPQSTTPINQLIEKGDRFAPFEGADSLRLIRLHERFNNAVQKPVFIGHYNLPVMPYLTSDHVACVNFKNHLVAYRWNEGDKRLDPSRLVYV
jgi:hypothetical protein